MAVVMPLGTPRGLWLADGSRREENRILFSRLILSFNSMPCMLCGHMLADRLSHVLCKVWTKLQQGLRREGPSASLASLAPGALLLVARRPLYFPHHRLSEFTWLRLSHSF